MNRLRSFAVVPAAGQSRRMGRPKLLLPWRGATVIDHVLRAWLASDVSHVVVVVRKDDLELAARCRALSVATVCPADDPPDMKASIQHALRHIAEQFRPVAPDVWLLAPADMPRLSASHINRLLAEHDPRAPAILVPTLAGRRGHPVLFPWRMSNDVFALRGEEGVNRLLDHHPARSIAVRPQLEHEHELEDMDTPDDYERLLGADRDPRSPDRKEKEKL